MMHGMTRENNITNKPKNKNDSNSIHRPKNEYRINMKREKNHILENEKSAI